MLRLNLDNLLKQHGMTKYALYKQLGMSYQNFNNMVSGKTKSIRYEMIETLCTIFDCTPNNIFEYDFGKQ